MKSDWTPGGFVSPEWFGFILHWTALIIEAARIAVIATGFLIAFLAAIRNVTRREDWDKIYLEVRVNSGAASCSASSS